jgi:N-methylhydantoinase B
VILDWATGEVLATTTSQFRDMYHKRTAAHWADDG